MALGNNQQDQSNRDQFNMSMNSGLDQVRHFQAELDKATAAIGLAELEAEEELLGVRLKNLSKSQQTKLAQLDQMLELEEKGIRELAKLKLTLSNRQFTLRKKEIQKEFQLYKEAAAELFKVEAKRRASKAATSPKKASSTADDIKTSTKSKPADSAVKKASRKVQSAAYNVDQVHREIADAMASLREAVGETSAIPGGTVGKPDNTRTSVAVSSPVVDLAHHGVAATDGLRESTESTIIALDAYRQATQDAAVTMAEAAGKPSSTKPSTQGTVIEEQKTRQFSSDANGMEKENLGRKGFTVVAAEFERLRTSIENQEGGILEALNAVVENGSAGSSQATIDLAGELLEDFEEAEAAVRKLREFNENKTFNMRLIQLAAEQNLRTKHAETLFAIEKTQANIEFATANRERLLELEQAKLREEHEADRHRAIMEDIAAEAKAKDREENRDQYIAEALEKLNRGHTDRQNQLGQESIDIEAEAKDLELNRDKYVLEARLALENEFAAKRNSLTKDLIEKEEMLRFTSAHRTELLAQQREERELDYLEEYNAHLLTAGEYAVSFEEFRADQERKRTTKAKKEATSDIISGINKFGTGEFSMTDIKKSYGEFMGKRTAELNTFDREKREAELRAANPDMSDEDLQKQLDSEAEKAEASAKVSAQFELLAAAAGNLMDALDADVRKIADMQGFIDTRLQGSKVNELYNLSYGKRLLEEIKWIAGASPYIKQEKIVDNVKTLIDKGISFDVKQRAFLMTIQEKIANTFNVADGTLLRLIRIQQQDTTAGRLGMESALNSFLNSMYETSEYLESVAGNVRSSLEEMQALMEGKAATEVEYQVQKWMGSLYSVGMSDNVVQNIARTFGQIASGDISGLTGDGTGNLLIMAANEAGMSIADILQDGLDADETNKLMQAMVNYLAEIAESSSDSRVVQQQLANVYGLKASDLKAATNLSSSLKDVANADMSYSGMMGQLNLMMNTIGLRTSISEGMTNMWDNMIYSMASTQASNPILYLLPKMANLLKDVTGGDGGGIALPFVNAMGFGVDLNTSVADLMLVASMAGTALGSLGPVLAGLSDLVNPLAGSTMLLRAGINPLGGVPVIARGTPATLQNLSGSGVSESGYVGNSSGDDIKNATLQDAEDDKKKQLVEAKDEEPAADVAMEANLAVINIYNLLEEVAHGSQSLRVRVINSGVGGAGASGGVASSSNPTQSGTDNGNWVLSF